jgi:hypothetical protein
MEKIFKKCTLEREYLNINGSVADRKMVAKHLEYLKTSTNPNPSISGDNQQRLAIITNNEIEFYKTVNLVSYSELKIFNNTRERAQQCFLAINKTSAPLLEGSNKSSSITTPCFKILKKRQNLR